MTNVFILGADLGGSNSRWVQLVGDDSSDNYKYIIAKPYTHQVADFPALTTSAAEYVRTYGIGKIQYAIIAAAGPVLNVEGRLRVEFSNVKDKPWICEQQEMADTLGIPLENVHIINDFQAASYSIKTLDPAKDFIQIHDGQASPQHPRLVLGPGTGLGTGLLTPDQGREKFTAWAAEPQHGAATAINKRQEKLMAAVKKIRRVQIVSNENLYCFGSEQGLVNLYNANLYLRRRFKYFFRPEEISPKTIVTRSSTDEICNKTVKDFCFGLGVYAGQQALQPLAFGGIYILGVHQKMGDNFNRAAFLDGMRQNNQPKLIDRMPVYIVTAETPAFKGLQYVAQTLKLAS